MKTIEQIIKQKPVYLNDWQDKFSLISDFDCIHITKAQYEAEQSPYPNEENLLKLKEKMKRALLEWGDINILFASYNYANYEGDAWVLLEKEGKLFEVNGSHCSCYGLEGQWDPEQVSLEELKHRLEKGTLGKDGSLNCFATELKRFLGL
jgi:hypothetical protein